MFRRQRRTLASRASGWFLTAGTAVLAGCGGRQTTPTPPVDVVQPIALTCPSDIRLDNVTGAGHAVVYSPPVVSGGVPPVAVSCSMASGASFPIGDSAVICQGTDGIHTAGQCHFAVTLIPAIPTLRVTKFMAFGDSITAGEINDDSGAPCNDAGHPAGLDGYKIFSLQPDLAYPAKVQQLLAARYTTQTFVVKNAGQSLDDTGDFPRFSSALRADRFEAVLLMQGTIDVAGGVSPSTIAANLDADIVEARRQGVTDVFLSTITPVVYESRGCFLTNPNIRAANDAIRGLAQRDNVNLVDAYGAIIGRESTLMGLDGLHPSVAGYQAIAEAFFAVIKDKLEVGSAASIH
jgi:lysophospholipase L1-like esterase